MDLEILESEGWEELEDLEDALAQGARVDIYDIWDAIGAGNRIEVQKMLEGLGYEFENDNTFRIVATPDDIRGEVFRVWVKEYANKSRKFKQSYHVVKIGRNE